MMCLGIEHKNSYQINNPKFSGAPGVIRRQSLTSYSLGKNTISRGMPTEKNHKTEPTVGFRKYNYGKGRKLRYSKTTQDDENRSNKYYSWYGKHFRILLHQSTRSGPNVFLV